MPYTMSYALSRTGLLAILMAGNAGCHSDAIEPDGPTDAEKQAVVDQYAAMVYASYTDTRALVEVLDAELEAFVAAPSAETLEAAKQAWLTARDVYGQTEVYRFYGGPIDHEETGVEGYINSWPLDEAYIDYVEGKADAGIVNHPELYPEITPELLVGLNTVDGEENISTGYHAIEFLLWGQDMSAEGPGDRPWQDYLEASSEGAPNGGRRGQYLLLLSDLLMEHLAVVIDAWEPGRSDNYAAEFMGSDPEASLQKILVGMGSLSGAELSGERLYTAYETRSQEDEHSCFSDNTLSDLYANAIALQNVYLGRYGQLDGPGMNELIQILDPDLDTALQAGIQASIDAIQAIPAPFDQQLLKSDSDPGRQAILTAVESLEAQTDLTVGAASALDLTINIGL